MEMENVIGQQYIVHRHKPVRIIAQSGLVHPVDNGRIQRAALRAERQRPQRLSQPAEGIAIAQEAPARRAKPDRQPLLPRLFESLASPRLMGPIFVVLGLILLTVAIAAAGAAERPADLRAFTLPEDGASVSVLLDAISTEAPRADEECSMPALPMTLSMAS